MPNFRARRARIGKIDVKRNFSFFLNLTFLKFERRVKCSVSTSKSSPGTVSEVISENGLVKETVWFIWPLDSYRAGLGKIPFRESLRTIWGGFQGPEGGFPPVPPPLLSYKFP